MIRSSQLRLSQAVLVCILALVMMGATDPDYRYKKLGHQLVCMCGDNQILLECNHVGCSESTQMAAELKQQMATGASDDEILKWFAAKYGPTVLAAPLRGGFDNIAWIVPGVLLLLATAGTAMLIIYWKRKNTAIMATPADHATPESDALRDRIRRDTEEL